MEERDWVTKYYRELEREKRQEILEQAIAQEGMSPDKKEKKKLLEERYEENKRDKLQVDRFIRGWMTLAYTRNTTRGLFGEKKRQREREKILKDWNFALAEQYGQEGQEALYQELHNMTELYLTICQDDKAYSSMILGLGKMNKNSLLSKMAREVYTVAYEIPREMGMAEELEIFTRAATDVFYEMFPRNRNLLETKIRGEEHK